MWITRTQANTITENNNLDDKWSLLSDDDKDKYLEKASTTLNGVPFRTDNEPLIGDRYKDGFSTDANGNTISDQPIPTNLMNAVAYLAVWYIDNPIDELTLLNEDIEASLSPFLANMPTTVQQILWNYIIDEWKGRDYLKEVARKLRETEESRLQRNAGYPISYVEAE